MTAPGIPMIFQGQEFLEDGFFHDDDPLDWTKVTTYSGILQLYTDLIALRLNKADISGGLSGASTNVHHINDNGKVIAYHRWGAGGVGDDVIIVMNFSNTNLDLYRIGFPHEGEWFMIFNSDSTEYSSDYTQMLGKIQQQCSMHLMECRTVELLMLPRIQSNYFHKSTMQNRALLILQVMA